jgi:hypothetical protein
MLGRRDFLAMSTAAMAQQQQEVEVLNARGRVPVSFIIDDSTCLVNLIRFAIPQLRAAWNNTRYHQDWRRMPVEIPDDFVRRFGEWCGEAGVKGKYSVVPFPACVGRLDREVPGWTREEMASSIRLVRTLMLPNWDIHPEMVTHTRIIDTRTGHPFPDHSLKFMENWNWCGGRSVDEIASYMSYALTILRNVDLPCEGITTPGAFGHDALPQLSEASFQACRDVFAAEIPHYFTHAVGEGTESVAPRVEGGPGRCVVNVYACTDDWTGSWDAQERPEPDRFITRDLSSGRLVEVIARGEPACLLAHWTGIYYDGRELGFRAFQEVVRRLHARYDNLVWMKLSEIARYWAARKLTRISAGLTELAFDAPFACPAFTIRLKGRPIALREVSRASALAAGTWTRDGERSIVCFDLPKGRSTLSLA